MLKKLIFSVALASCAFLPFLGNQVSGSEKSELARVNWNININTGVYPCGPCYCGPYWGNPYYNPFFYPCVPPCYGYPPPCWVW